MEIAIIMVFAVLDANALKVTVLFTFFSFAPFVVMQCMTLVG